MTPLEAFTAAYIEAALWSTNDRDDNPLDQNYNDDIHADTLAQMEKDCAEFYAAYENAIHCEGAPAGPVPTEAMAIGKAEHAGHDFWLTRCGHGAGFWDGDWPEPYADILTQASEAYGNIDLYVSDDGMVI